MADYLVELGLEEIPARFLDGLSQEFQQKVSEQLQAKKLAFEGVSIFCTYRRIALLVNGLNDTQEDQTLILKGPPASIAIDAQGNFTPAGVGFAKKCGVDPSELTQVEIKGQTYLQAEKFEKGAKVSDLIPDIIETVVNSLSLPIAMRWGEMEKPFIRPLHWIVSLFNNEHLPITLFNTQSGSTSYGHRFLTHHPEPAQIASGHPIEIKNASEYETTLEANFVIVDPKKRRKMIDESLRSKITDIDQALLNEVTHLVEYPAVLEGDYRDHYLNLPPEVLTSCMKKHQKYFPKKQKGALSSGFVFVADSVTDQNQERIIQGNEKVLEARLADVDYFYDQDLKSSAEGRSAKLEKVVYQKGLGSVSDRVERLIKISQLLASTLGYADSIADIMTTATHCKSDLVSHMVYELPELQGVMGGYYYQKEFSVGADHPIPSGIKEHYYPRFAEDVCPESIPGIVVGIADKIDTVVSCFKVGQIPTGSQDPLGVRRALLGIFKTLIHHDLSLNIVKLVEDVYDISGPERDHIEKCNNFIEDRLKRYLLEHDKAVGSHDIVASTIHFTLNAFKQGRLLTHALASLKKENMDSFKNMTESFVRINNLALKKEGEAVFSEALLKLGSEKNANQVLSTLQGAVKAQSSVDDMTLFLSALTAFSEVMGAYFDEVLVMDENKDIRQNRLAFLTQIIDTVSPYIYFNKIEV